MTASSNLPAPNLMPLMRYRDLAEAMGWLDRAFGFEKQIAVTDSDGEVIYGQMTYRGGLIMMGAVRDTDLDKLMRQPDEVGDVETQSCYLVVDDADEHYERAVASGADVVLDLKSDGLGRRGYSCRDPEGHIWSFGTYNPGKGLTMAPPAAAAAAGEEPDQPSRRGRGFLMGVAGLLLIAGAAAWMFNSGVTARIAGEVSQQSAAEADKAYAELVKVRGEKRQAEERVAALSRELETERARVAPSADATSSEALNREKAAREAAEKELAAVRAELEAERTRRAGDQAKVGTPDAVAEEKAAREAAEKAVASLREQLEREQSERDEAVEAKRVIEEKLAAKSSITQTPPPAAATETATGAQREASEGPSKPEERGIETSATNAAPQAENEAASAPADADADEDQDTAAATAKKARDRTAKIQKPRRAESRGSKRYPSYVTDMQHVWPYAQWSN
jgi:uncharacterized glyoxalase superfamily protein PhnB